MTDDKGDALPEVRDPCSLDNRTSRECKEEHRALRQRITTELKGWEESLKQQISQMASNVKTDQVAATASTSTPSE